MLTEPEIINPFVESINQMIEHKKAIWLHYSFLVVVIAKEWNASTQWLLKRLNKITKIVDDIKAHF
jgi:hypothetical protein